MVKRAIRNLVSSHKERMIFAWISAALLAFLAVVISPRDVRILLEFLQLFGIVVIYFGLNSMILFLCDLALRRRWVAARWRIYFYSWLLLALGPPLILGLLNSSGLFPFEVDAIVPFDWTIGVQLDFFVWGCFAFMIGVIGSIFIDSNDAPNTGSKTPTALVVVEHDLPNASKTSQGPK